MVQGKLVAEPWEICYWYYVYFTNVALVLFWALSSFKSYRKFVEPSSHGRFE